MVAPTGSGKTLAAFLWALDRLVQERADEGGDEGRPATRILYISPLKALGVDVERNLHAPLVGIGQTARRLGTEPTPISVGVRSGDTKPAERRRLQAHPPDVLITTPESLYLMLTSSARESLAGVETVILDEVHAVAGTKRGAHLALTLERLDALLERPAQRIGLSATVRPLETVAKFLGGSAPVRIVAPPSEKAFDLRVVVPVADLSDLGSSGGPERSDRGRASQRESSEEGIVFGDATQAAHPRAGSIWPYIETEIVDQVLEHRTTIVFVNSRGLAERLAARLNEEYEQRIADARAASGGGGAAGVHTDGADGAAAGVEGADGMDGAGRSRGGSAGSGAGDAAPGGVENGEDAAVGAAAAGGGVDSGIGAGFGIRAAPGAEGDRPRPRVMGAQLMGGSGDFKGADADLARAHHGSVSKETRAEVEEELKAGRLRCVVATSSLELGIDMGDVDLVIQVEAPPSVASGLQRLGRAGHQVGGVSRGRLLPKHRADVLHSAVVASRMLSGSIEVIELIENPLDVLAQQIIAAASVDPWAAEDWLALVRRAAPFQRLSRGLLDSTLDLLAGKYPSDEFAQLRPRILWDRDADVFEGRPGAQRLAVTGGGTIPDRGMFGVFMFTGAEGAEEDASTASAGTRREGGMRVGELDEEMVYESRVGDVIALGSTSWRIREIGPDRVRVTPAFGEPGRLPFWRGDALGRPAELGRAIGESVRAIAQRDAVPEALAPVLDEHSETNLLAYVREQREVTGQVPSDRVLVVERNRDELGDWRVILHSLYGRRVHAPWALMVTARVRERFGMEASAVASDDGIVVRVPDIEGDPPGAELFAFEREEIEPVVTREVGASALFAARFRENAARALLLPRLHPGKRSPLWQQRLRAAQLLEVARRYPDFPIILETVREVLHDVYDLDAFTELLGRIAAREVRLTEVITGEPSPFARTMLFGYVGQFLYEGDQPLAERRAAALSLDAGLLADLLGATSLRELLDPEAIEQVADELQKRASGFRIRGLEGVADALRLLGPLSTAEIAERLEFEEGDGAGEAGPDSLGEPGASDRPGAPGRPGAPDQPGASGRGSPVGSEDRDGPDGGGHPATDPGAAPDAASAEAGSAMPVETVPAAFAVPAEAVPAVPVEAGSAVPVETVPAMPVEAGSAEAASPGTAPRPIPDAALEAAREIAEELIASKRALAVRIAGQERLAAIEDASRLRDALGVPLPIGVPNAFIDPVADPLGDLVGRFARTNAPFTTGELAARLGLGEAVVADVLGRLELANRVVRGEFTPARTGEEWVEDRVLRRIRARTLAKLRHEVEPVSQTAYARFLPEWQQVGASLRGVDGVIAAIDQLQGTAIPASAWESLVLPARVEDYAPGMLDELLASGEVRWHGRGGIGSSDGWISLHLADTEHLTLAENPAADAHSPLAERIRAMLERRGAMFLPQIAEALADSPGVGDGMASGDGTASASPRSASPRFGASEAGASRVGGSGISGSGVGSLHFERASASGEDTDASRASTADRPSYDAIADALWELAWSGLVTTDTLVPLRALLAGPAGSASRTAHRTERRPARGRTFRSWAAAERRAAQVPPRASGRWSIVGTADEEDTVRAQAAGELLLDRYGVVTRGSVEAAGTSGGFALQYRVLAKFEEAGQARRGYFVDRLGAAQFATAGAIDVLRRADDDRFLERPPHHALTLAATDPANAYGAALPWPEHGGSHRPGRKAGALVTLVDGALVLYIERGGKTLLRFDCTPEAERAAAHSLADTVRRARIPGLVIEKVNGEYALNSPLARALEDGGFSTTPRGLRMRL
ncbi:Probable ATP-dependent helicase lhr [Gulosibacter sp. 10]|nr:Probable ATP-dependent helicase lhr [Gulosibacter sp. 10]